MGECYEQLSFSERIYLQSQLELSFKTAAIAAALKRGPSTISRELRRNGWRRSTRGHLALADDGDYGIITTLPWGVHMAKNALVPPIPATALVQPTPIYELLLSLAVF